MIIYDGWFEGEASFTGPDGVIDQGSQLEREDADLFEGIDPVVLAEAVAIGHGEHRIPRLLSDAHGRALYRYAVNQAALIEMLRLRLSALNAAVPKQ